MSMIRKPMVHHNDVDHKSVEQCTRVHGMGSIESAPQAHHRQRTQVPRPIGSDGQQELELALRGTPLAPPIEQFAEATSTDCSW